MIKKTYSFVNGGEVCDVYTLSNKKGVEVDILTYGARIIRLLAPDKKGELGDIIVGCKTPEDYCKKNPCFGSTVGRYANRIENATFALNGVRYYLEKNDGEHTLHGGHTACFDCRVWDAEIKDETLVMRLVSPDGEGGFPGRMEVEVAFTLTESGELVIDYTATSDKDTPCNLTNHAYFNLGNEPTVLGHELMIKARKVTKADKELIVRGELLDIAGTGYDFYAPKTIGRDIFGKDEMLQNCGGYDLNYCLERETENGLEHFGYVYEPETGRRMDCYTTLPAVQLYTACSTGGFKGKKDYVTHCAFCLETQYYPNSVNCPNFPSSILKAGEVWKSKTVYKFSVVE
ncbi:MAG: galactose mutarotase [Clostridia bacterium]|nr:galactose mutarotase [Clostridia bacterium]